MSQLNVKACLELFGLAVAMALLLFIPAGMLRYWPAWNFLVVSFVTWSLTTVHLMRHDRFAHMAHRG